VTSADVQKLEALFGMSAAVDHPAEQEEAEVDNGDSDDDAFWDALAKTKGIQEISFVTPLNMVQKWVATNDPLYAPATSSFVTTDARNVDEGYEFVFSTMASVLSEGPKEQEEEAGDGSGQRRSYLVMSNFLSSSATSFEKFAGEVTNIMRSAKLEGAVDVLTLHPEHVDAERRSPVPVFVLQWK